MSIVHNPTIDVLLNRHSVRKFTPEAITADEMETLETVALRAASSQFLNDFSIIRIEDTALKTQFATIGNQSFIAEAPLLYLFVADEYRNLSIAQAQGVDIDQAFALRSSHRFIQMHNDAVLALQSMETAANSLELGCVILGCILNDPQAIIDLLNLPQYTYPVLGLAIGHPDEYPLPKPRLAREAQVFVDSYNISNDALFHSVSDFDAAVHEYYVEREESRPVNAFSAHIKEISLGRSGSEVSSLAQGQGFLI